MIRIPALLLLSGVFFCIGCSQKPNPVHFSSYEEAKKFCDAAVKSKNLSGLIEHADFTSVPEPQLENFKEGLTNFERAISKKTLEKTLEFSPEEHEQFLKDEFAKQTPEMQKLTGPWPEARWNIKPDKFIVYVFVLREPGAESEFNLTLGLSQQDEGWVIACSY